MKFKVTAPHEMEAKKVLVQQDQRGIEVEPLVLKTRHIMPVAYVTAVGNAGMERKGILFFNANTGDFSVQTVEEQADVTFDFDNPESEFKQKRAKARQKRQSRASKDDSKD